MELPQTRFFDRPFSLLLVLGGLPLLFLPKINLLSIGGKETAGIRFDDLALLSLAIVIFWGHFALKKKMCTIERLVFAIVAFSVLSFLLNRLFVSQGWLHVDASLFYCLRILEYFIFFYIGAMAAQFFDTAAVIRAFFVWNLALMALQKFGLIGQFSIEGYVSDASGRVVGIASFPSEAGMLLDMMFAYLLFQEGFAYRYSKLMPAELRSLVHRTHACWLFLLTSVMVIITGSRIAIGALAVVFLFKVKEILKKGGVAMWAATAAFLIICAALAAVLMQNTSAIAERSAGLLSMKNIELIGVVWEKINLDYDPIGNESVKYAAYDMSWWMRIHKWCYALKIYWLNPECWLQGVGPGFAMAALDGGWLRVLTEYGIIGSVLFWRLFSAIYKQSTQLKWMVVTFGFNMIFFDVYLAYKPMSLLFFVSGATWVAQQASQKTMSPASVSRSFVDDEIRLGANRKCV